jgi:hypothetical protein
MHEEDVLARNDPTEMYEEGICDEQGGIDWQNNPPGFAGLFRTPRRSRTMPTVKKTKRTTTRRTRTKKPEGVASRIHPVGDMGGIKLLVYGRGKTGKTRFASTFQKKVLIAGTEDGTRSVGNVKGVDFIQLTSSQDLEDVIKLAQDGGYSTLCLDHAGGLQDLILKEILGLEDVPLQKSWGIAKREDWGTTAIQTKERLRHLLDLADTRKMSIVIIAHERNFEETEVSDLIFPSVGAALTPSVAGWLNGAVEYICQTFIREETKEVRLVKGKKPQTKGTGRYEYCLRIGPHPVFMTGFRVPIGVEVPDVVVDPSYTKIRKLIEG